MGKQDDWITFSFADSSAKETTYFFETREGNLEPKEEKKKSSAAAKTTKKKVTRNVNKKTPTQVL